MLKAFTTDGCSGGMSCIAKLLRVQLPWEYDCIQHDIEYWIGGNAQDRKRADHKLRRAVINKGYFIIGWCMFIAVRIGGTPYLPLSWRWGYGWDFRERYYTPRSGQEVKLLVNAYRLYT